MATVPGSKRLLDISGNNISTALSLTASGTLLDVNGAAGASGQVLSSIGSGVDWVDASSVIGGPYLPLTGGSSYPLTGTLYGTSTNFSGNGDYAGSMTLGTGASTAEANLQIGQGRTGNGYSYIDLIGDATYTDYGLRIIRNNAGANTSSAIIHRGTGNLEISSVESSSTLFKTNNTTALTLTNTQNAIFTGNVGIGTTSPNAKLQVNDNVRIGSTSTGVRFYIQGVDEFRADALDVGGSGWNSLHFRADGTDGLFLQKDTNNVGIGTTSPGAKLHVDGTAIFDTQTGAQPFYITRDGVANQALKIYVDDSAAVFESIQDETADDYGSFIFKMDGGTTHPYFDIRKDNATQVRFDGSGNVGIGTTSPGQKLDVAGNAIVRGDIEARDTYPSIYVNHSGTAMGGIRSDATNKLELKTLTTAPLSFQVNSSEKMRITSTGNVGIGTTSPGKKLHVVGDTYIEESGTGQTLLLGRTNGQPTIKADNSNGGHMIIDSYSNFMSLNHYISQNVVLVAGGGNVGIGTTSPGYKLDVSGDARFTGDVTVSGGDITLGGTGRIQGIDTVSAGTDATSKTYVDNAIAGVPQGDITAVTAGTFLTGGGTSGSVTLNADATKLSHIVDSSNGTVGAGWITVAQASGARKAGEVYVTDGESSDHSYIRIEWMRSYADSNFTVLNCGGHANRIQGVRVLEDTSDTTYGKKYLQVKVTATSNYYVIVTAPGTIPNYGDFIAETPVLENTKTGYNIKGNTIEDLHNSSLGSEQGITSGGNIELNDARYVFTKGDVLSLSAGGAGSGTEIVLDDPASVIKLNSDTIARDEFRVSSSTDGTGDDVFIANSGNGTFTLGDIEGLGSEAFIQGDASNIKIRNSSADSLVADSNNNVSIPNGNLIISEQIGVNTTNFNPQAGIIVNGNQTFGTPGGGSNVNARYLSIEGGADGAGEGSGRIFFTEHNSTTAAMDNYGMSLGYRGGPTSIVGASGQTWGGLSQIGNGEWGMWGHNNSANGALIMHGDRAATYVDFSGNNIQGITDAYIADQIIHTGDTNTYMQFHAADQWRVVTGGSERLEVNNTQVTVANNLQVGGSIYASQYIYHTGDTNTFMRFPANDTISWNTAGSERMRINSSGNVGIGTTAPGSDLEIFNTSGSTVISEARISSLVTSGYGGQSNLWLRTSNYGSAMIAFGNQNGASAVANSASGKITYNSYNRIFTVTADSNALLTLGGSTDRVGVNQTNPQYTLDVTGNGRFTSTVTATNFILSSDEKLKENVEKVCGNKVEAEWKTFELKTEKGQKRYGVIAQELEKTNPEFVREDSQGFKSVAYIDLLIAKIAELEARLEKLEK